MVGVILEAVPSLVTRNRWWDGWLLRGKAKVIAGEEARKRCGRWWYPQWPE